MEKLTKEERYGILLEIFKIDNFSISQIVEVKELSMKQKLEENNKLISGLAFRATSIFGDTPKDTLKNIEQVKPLVAEDIIKSGVVRGTPFEERLLKQYPNITNPPIVPRHDNKKGEIKRDYE